MKYIICNRCSVYIMYDDSSHLTAVEQQGVDEFISGLDTTLAYADHEDDKTFVCDCCCVGIDNATARYFEEV